MRNFRVKPVLVAATLAFAVEELRESFYDGVTFENWAHVGYAATHAKAEEIIEHVTQEPRFYGKN